MFNLREASVGFAFGASTVLALGCSCWIYFTDIVLTDIDSGDRHLGVFGVLGYPGLWVAWGIGVAGAVGLLARRFERLSTVALIAQAVYLSLFSIILYASWCRPMWRLGT